MANDPKLDREGGNDPNAVDKEAEARKSAGNPPRAGVGGGEASGRSPSAPDSDGPGAKGGHQP